MTDKQTDFMVHLGRTLDVIAERLHCGDISELYFSQVFDACWKNDDLEIARLGAEMVLQLWHFGVNVDMWADLWVTHFNSLFCDTAHVPLTSPPPIH